MKILISSPTFLPVMGGHVQSVDLLAGELSAQGHEVCVLCQNAGDNEGHPYQILRRPGLRTSLEAGRWADVILHANISLKLLALLLLTCRPWAVWHHGWYFEWGKSDTWISRFKRWISRFATNIACSRAVVDYLGVPCEVISGPYDDAVFRLRPEITRDRDILFVGRLISDKGVDLMLDAVVGLRRKGLTPSVTITGGGPEETALKKQVLENGIGGQVTFTGPLKGLELASLMSAHRILVVPSRWHEPFGIVALEGIACGCAVVGSEGGGLKDAIGPCGLTFPNENIEAMTQALGLILEGRADVSTMKESRSDHLAKHTRQAVAVDCLRVLERRALRTVADAD